MLCDKASPSILPLLEEWLVDALNSEGRRRASLHREREQAQRAESLGKWATLVVSNLYRIPQGAESVVVEDWEDGCKKVKLKLDPSKGTAQEQADEAFAKARKLRRGSKVISLRWNSLVPSRTIACIKAQVRW